MHFNQKTKIYITFIAFAILLSLSIIFLNVTYFQKRAEGIALDNALNKTLERESVIEAYLTSAENTLKSIEKSRIFQEYIHHSSNPDDLEDLFISFAEADPDIMKLRVLNSEGYETVRIERSEITSPPFIVEGDDLQDKSNRYFYQEGMSSEPNQVWFSAFDLNIENNMIEVPYRPTFRGVLNIEDDRGFNGSIVINYFAEPFFDNLVRTPLYDMVIADQEGTIIWHYESNNGNDQMNWGNSLESAYHLSNIFPNSYEDILSQTTLHTDTLVSRKLEVPVYNGMILIMQLRENYLLEEEERAFQENLITFIAILVFSVILTYIIMRLFSRTLFNIDELQKLNASLDQASSIAQIGFWEMDAKSQVFTWHSGIKELLEIEEEISEMTKEIFMSYIPKEQHEEILEQVRESIKAHKSLFVTHQIETPSHKRKYVQEKVQHYYDHKGHVRSVGSIYDITDKFLQQQKFEYLLDNASDGIHVLDQKGNLIIFSRSFAETLGYTLEEMKEKNVFDWDTGLSKSSIIHNLLEIMKDKKRFMTQHIRKDGTLIDVEVYAKPITLDGKTCIYASQRDITDLIKVQNELEENRRRWQFAVEGNKDGLWDWDLKNKSVYFSSQCHDMLGYPKDSLTDSLEEWRKSIHPEDRDRLIEVVNDFLENDQASYICEYRYQRKQGDYIWLRDRGMVFERDSQGKALRVIGTISDISEHIYTMELIKKQSVTDELTQVGNRKAYNDKLKTTLSSFQRYQHTFTLLMFDIDHFKKINDRYGHDVGDKVLINLCRVIEERIRETDFLYRIGGEEFVLLLTDTTIDHALVLADDIRRLVEDQVYQRSGLDNQVTISIGLTEVQKDDSSDSMFKRADELLYAAKDAGRNQVKS